MRKQGEIERVKRAGRRYRTSFFSLTSCSCPDASPRVCIVVGRRFGTAVARNRAKRRFRELARQFRHQLVRNRAFVVFPRRLALETPFASLRQIWVAALQHEGLLTSEATQARQPCESSFSG